MEQRGPGKIPVWMDKTDIKEQPAPSSREMDTEDGGWICRALRKLQIRLHLGWRMLVWGFLPSLESALLVLRRFCLNLEKNDIFIYRLFPLRSFWPRWRTLQLSQYLAGGSSFIRLFPWSRPSLKEFSPLSSVRARAFCPSLFPGQQRVR